MYYPLANIYKNMKYREHFFYPNIFLYFLGFKKNKSYCLWLKNNIVFIFVLYLVIIVKAFDFSVCGVCLKSWLKNDFGMIRNSHNNITILEIIVSFIPNMRYKNIL